MKLGLQIPSFTWPGGPAEIRPTLAEIARTADSVGYDSIWVMDHFFQIRGVGAPEEPMLEAYTTLGFLAAHTESVGLGTLVTGVTYRHPGILAKTVTTVDVLSGGRAWLGIGAAWNEEEHLGLGVPFPPLAERFERLEETIKIILQMWSDDEGPFEGKYYKLARTLNSPQPLSVPRPRILLGGGGERKTLRLVAQYADACNLFTGPEELRAKLDVLRRHCEAVGRDFDSIMKTVYYVMDIGDNGERVPQVLDDLAALAEAGADGALGALRGVERIDPIEIVGREIIPKIAAL
ncbi:MAG: LLM class F420-dependent oxidoreductase [Actinobacteria bacterium]|nr:MAG: LLM class F420-dependent oxidoreductase [Actinomycetota bacterium]